MFVNIGDHPLNGFWILWLIDFVVFENKFDSMKRSLCVFVVFLLIGFLAQELEWSSYCKGLNLNNLP